MLTKKSSLRVSWEALRLPFWNTKGGSAVALPCQVSLEIFSGFPKTTACSAANCLVADTRPPFLFTGLPCILSLSVSTI